MASPDVISLTPHHAKYYAHDLTRRAATGMDRLSMALFDASVDFNPHQIEAPLFALQNPPLSKGVILIPSHNFAHSIRDELRAIRWDLVVIEEAHKLRNAYRQCNKVGQGIRCATEDCRKLLTA